MASHRNKLVSIKLTGFYMKIVGFWYAENKREQWMLDAALGYTIAAVTFAVAVEGVDLYYSWGDFTAVMYNACATMPLLAIALRVIVFMIHRGSVIDLIRFTEKNFWQATYDNYGDGILKECEKRGIFFFSILSFTVQATGSSYLTVPLIENIGVNETDRNFPFRLWVNFPVTTTPYYEVTYVIESLSTIHSGICFFCFDNFMGILNIHIIGQFKILQHRLEILCDENPSDGTIEGNLTTKLAKDWEKYKLQNENSNISEKAHSELKECVKQHLVLINYVEKLEDIFNPIILFQMIVSSLFMCVGGFQLFVAELTTIRRVTFVLHQFTAFAQLYSFTWTCNEIIVQSLEVAEAASRSKWYMLPNCPMGYSVRHALILVMVRARRACYISAGKFKPMSLQAFTSILSTNLSYFTLLRQVSEDL